MNKEQSKREKIREFIEEMWYRYQCYYRLEVECYKDGRKPRGKSLGYYLKYSEEERQRKSDEAMAEALYIIDHWDEIQRQRDEEFRQAEEKYEETMQKIKKIILFWK